MEEKKTIFDFGSQVFCTFGFSILAMAVFCILVGDEAKEISSLFALGDEGLSIHVIWQFFAVNVLIAGFRFLFFSERFIRGMSTIKRTLCMLGSVVLTVAFFVYFCGWFTFDVWQAWFSFFISFGLCFVISLFLMRWKEKLENRKMEEGLKRAKEKLEDVNT